MLRLINWSIRKGNKTRYTRFPSSLQHTAHTPCTTQRRICILGDEGIPPANELEIDGFASQQQWMTRRAYMIIGTRWEGVANEGSILGDNSCHLHISHTHIWMDVFCLPHHARPPFWERLVSCARQLFTFGLGYHPTPTTLHEGYFIDMEFSFICR